MVKNTFSKYVIIYYILFIVLVHAQHHLNSTGGTFPLTLLRETVFTYEFNTEDVVSYFDGGTTTGKCNIMGYWHIGNTDPRSQSPSSHTKEIDTLICTDLCTFETCGFNSQVTPRKGHLFRKPLVDFAITEVPFNDIDYEAFPDLQMYPAFAGAVVPIYNIPELKELKETIILSRPTIAAIFLGQIRYWNDARIIADNQGQSNSVVSALSSLQQAINVVVRHDSSGISKILLQALNSFDPIKSNVYPDYSFGNTVGRATLTSKPLWCDPFTDEIHNITITGCFSSSQVHLKAVSPSNEIMDLYFPCNIASLALENVFKLQGDMDVIVQKTAIKSGMWSYLVGHKDRQISGTNINEPIWLPSKTANEANVSISTLQEGGFWNSHYAVSDYHITNEIQSIFVNGSAGDLTFNIIFHTGSGWATTKAIDASLTPSHLADAIFDALNDTLSGIFINVTHYTNPAGSLSHWVEYRLSFSDKYSSMYYDSSHRRPVPLIKLTAHPKANNHLNINANNSFIVSRFLAANNFPRFKDDSYSGVASGGKYTCYKQGHGFVPWTYYTASLLDLNAVVTSMPYSIGYSTLVDANINSLDVARLINSASVVVTASSSSISYAVMEKGGNLDSHFNAVLVDGASSQAWPISGYNYFIIRKHSHIGDCSRRKAAMTFLYDFYHNDIVKSIATRLGFAYIPDFIKEIILDKLINEVMCSDGRYALPEFRIKSTAILTTAAFEPSVNTYMSSYLGLDSRLVWNLTSSFHSDDVWSMYSRTPDKSMGIFTAFSTAAQKKAHFKDRSSLTVAFAHIAVAIIYRLDEAVGPDGQDIPLIVNVPILAGIFGGTISRWNDPIILDANPHLASLLVNREIKVVVRSEESDTNSIFLRYLVKFSESFRRSFDPYRYGLGEESNLKTLDFANKIPAHRLIDADTSTHLDDAVTYTDGSIGYFLLVSPPVSRIAGFCPSEYGCNIPSSRWSFSVANDDVQKHAHTLSVLPNVIFPDDDGKSIEACTADSNTAVTVSDYLSSYDLMTSTAPGCYPIVGTVDFTVYRGKSQSCPSFGGFKNASLHQAPLIETRVNFAQWLYKNNNIVKPLRYNSIVPTNAKDRAVAFTSICSITCGGASLGYDFCGYRDCKWDSGDFDQIVSPCDPKTALRTVTYQVKDSSDCLKANLATYPKSTTIQCEYLPSQSPLGALSWALCMLSFVVCGVFLGLIFYYQNEKILKKSQVIFVKLFVIGGMCLNLFVAVLLDENSDSRCLARPWIFNFSATLMFAPLIMKLRRVDVIVHNPSLKKITIHNSEVLLQVLMLLLIDFLLLALWSGLSPSMSIGVSTQYAGVLGPVTDMLCSHTGLHASFEIALLVYKCVLIGYAIRMSARLWNIAAEISEAKHFAVAIYNIATLGSIGYFLGIFLGQSDAGVGNLLRCLGISSSAAVAVVLILMPKFLVIDGFIFLPSSAAKFARGLLQLRTSSNDTSSLDLSQKGSAYTGTKAHSRSPASSHGEGEVGQGLGHLLSPDLTADVDAKVVAKSSALAYAANNTATKVTISSINDFDQEAGMSKDP